MYGDSWRRVKKRAVRRAIENITIRVFEDLREDQAMGEYVTINKVFDRDHPRGFRVLAKAVLSDETMDNVQRFRPTLSEKILNCRLRLYFFQFLRFHSIWNSSRKRLAQLLQYH